MGTTSIASAARQFAAGHAACVGEGYGGRPKRAKARKARQDIARPDMTPPDCAQPDSARRKVARTDLERAELRRARQTCADIARAPRQRTKPLGEHPLGARPAQPQPCEQIAMPRRRFLLAAAGLAAGATLHTPTPALAKGAAAYHGVEVRYADILLSAAGERFRGVYFENGRYLDDALKQIDWTLRDFHYDESMMMDLRLIDLLSDIRADLNGRELIVTSGYRCEATNDRLRRNGSGAVKNSLHLKGMAADFHCPDVAIPRLARIVTRREAGGVGRYDRRGFIHADVGQVRYWRG